jgi:hypothetical protein
MQHASALACVCVCLSTGQTHRQQASALVCFCVCLNIKRLDDQALCMHVFTHVCVYSCACMRANLHTQHTHIKRTCIPTFMYAYI